MPHLQLNLLGSFQVTLDGDPVPGVTSPRIQALLAYLAVEAGHLHSREALAALLWPEKPPARAAQNLRKSLSRLNHALTTSAVTGSAPTPAFILADRHTVSLNRQAGISIDAAQFSAAITFSNTHAHRRLEHCRRCAARLREAADLYRGDFLHDVISDSGPFAEWALLHREWMHRQALHTLYTLAAHFHWLGDFSAAHRHAWRQVQMEPWNERGHRQIMRALAAMGRRSEALAQYETLSRTLDDELGVAPSQDSTRLFQNIASGTFRPKDMTDLLLSETPHATGHTRNSTLNLPVHHTPFVGRVHELTEIAERLDAANCHLLTLVGPGGAGKTRLAAQIAREKADEFAAGACFVSLATVTQAGTLPTALLDALRVPLPEEQSSRLLQERLLDLLRGRELLLILDNYEQLLPETTLLQEILQNAPLVKMLITSRRRLNLQAEWIVDVDGLAYPRSKRTSEPAAFPAVELFLQNARRLRPDFTPTVHQFDAIIQICEAVAGIPLALELAAAHTRSHSVHDIAAGLQNNVDFLSSTMPDAGSRHRSLRAVFDHSWRLLDQEQRGMLQRLTVFQGGFSAAASAAVAGAAPQHLSTLLDQSLLRLVQPDRYDLHATIRQYAAEKLSAQPPAATETARRHARYYADLLSNLGPRHSAATPAPESILPDLDNVRAAWDWAVTVEELDILQLGLDGLAHFYERIGHLQEGHQALHNAASRLASSAKSSPASLDLHTRLLARQLFFLYGLARYDQTIATARAILQHTSESETAFANGPLQAEAHLYWGMALARRGEYQATRRQLQVARQQAQDNNVPHLEADSLRAMGQIEVRVGNYAAAHDAYRESLNACRRAAYRRGEAYALGGLGSVLLVTERPLQAREHYQHALQIFAEVGDGIGETTYLDNLGTTHWAVGDFTSAIELLHRSLTIRRQIGDRRGEGASLFHLAIQSHYQGDFSKAHDLYAQALDIYQTIGYRRGQGEVLAHLCLLYHHQQRHDTAPKHGQQAVEIARETDDRSDLGYALTFLGHALAALQQFSPAAAAYEEALRLRREIGEHNRTTEPMAGLAYVALAQNDLPQALAHVEAILQHLQTGSLDVCDEPARVHLSCYNVLQAAGDPRAAQALAAGRRLLEERAQYIPDGALRRSFLEDIPAHRRLLA